MNVLIEIDGVVRGAFKEVSGLTAKALPGSRAGVDGPGTLPRGSSPAKYPSISLMRGYTRDETLWQWYQGLGENANDRRNVVVVLLNDRSEAVLRYHVQHAFPKKFEGPALNATGNEVCIEVIELEHEGVRRDP
ncbi:MAG: phage tail protein [Caldimonas sp.]